MLGKIFISILFIFNIHLSCQLPISNAPPKGCGLQRASNTVQVYITISSLTVSTTPDGIVKRQLEINWIGGQRAVGDSVGVYDRDPKLQPHASPLCEVDPTEYPGGYFKSSVELSVVFFNLTCLSRDPCLGYWAAYKDSNGNILSSSCLQTRPFWMKENSRFLSNLTLSEIMIPGSHDSGSFDYYRELAPVAKYEYAQEETIFNQLVYGLRYFDLRVGYYKKYAYKYYINHNFLRTPHPVKTVLEQVYTYINATKEIVILDFHNFPVGFTSDSIHLELMDMIVNIFGPYLIPYQKKYVDATFSSLWNENKRILISYDSEVRETVYSDLLWPRIPRAWGNKQHPKDLELYFEEYFSKPLPEGLWASMAELTPNTETIILHPEAGLRVFAEEINRNVTEWFRDLYWHKANIVATDYFMGNNMIDVAIETNQIRGTCPKKFWKRR